MAHTVVCIARVAGSAGAEVGQKVAAALGFRLVDEEIIQQAAESAGIAVEELAEVEKRKGVLSRLLESLAIGGAADGFMAGMPSPIAPPSVIDPNGLRAMIRTAIQEIATEGSAVIISHGASLALADRDDVLRVFVTASTDHRIAELVANGDDAKHAAKTISADDAGRADYLKKFYDVGEELPTHYDLVCNSDRLSADVITDLVVRAATGS
jgi:CMP/dCMP kinase